MCQDCGISKKSTEFRVYSSRASGISPRCRECDKKISRLTYEQDKETFREIRRAYRSRDIEKIKNHIINYPSQKPEYRNSPLEEKLLKNPDYYIDKSLRVKHGVTQDWYNKKLAAQQGVCAICGSSEAGGNGGRFAIDHDHSCPHPKGKTCEECRRGLICMRCNIWIERLESIPGVAKRAIAYLNKYQKNDPKEHPLPLFGD